MINALFSTPNYVAAKKLLDFTVLRHEAIASNLANVETPQYKRMDVSPQFASELNRAIASQEAGHIQSMRPSLAIDTTKHSSKLDGNTVELESELAEMNKNFMAHTLETQLISSAFSHLRLAITGRPS